ncbi:hypothetical protein OC834_004447 [Tilletia horrida]|nr:hypothetical protein OC834_004447 [Tilletia horrida]
MRTGAEGLDWSGDCTTFLTNSTKPSSSSPTTPPRALSSPSLILHVLSCAFAHPFGRSASSTRSLAERATCGLEGAAATNPLCLLRPNPGQYATLPLDEAAVEDSELPFFFDSVRAVLYSWLLAQQGRGVHRAQVCLIRGLHHEFRTLLHGMFGIADAIQTHEEHGITRIASDPAQLLLGSPVSVHGLLDDVLIFGKITGLQKCGRSASDAHVSAFDDLDLKSRSNNCMRSRLRRPDAGGDLGVFAHGGPQAGGDSGAFAHGGPTQEEIQTFQDMMREAVERDNRQVLQVLRSRQPLASNAVMRSAPASGATDILPTIGGLPTSGRPGVSSGIRGVSSIMSGTTDILSTIGGLPTSALPGVSCGIAGVTSIVSGTTDILPTIGGLPTSGRPGVSSGIRGVTSIMSGTTDILPTTGGLPTSGLPGVSYGIGGLCIRPLLGQSASLPRNNFGAISRPYRRFLGRRLRLGPP